ncbi:MAG: L,D-transpeptidase [Candidatus Gygaella obscura]|nr:L,D-transpeptidase [Candidatus Gygaella obscura]
MIKIIISKQKLYYYLGTKLEKVYLISTSKYGIGNKTGSNRTPLGLHHIVSKIGRNASLGAVFKRRRNTGNIAKIRSGCGDLMTTRILRLEGLERRVNKGKGIDSFWRCIYIHGTPEERLIGKPASYGCIRMKNRDIIELFNLVKRGELVHIFG